MSKRVWPLGLWVLFSASAFAVAPLPAPRPLDAPPANAIETAGGMAYVVIKAGPDQNRMVSGDFIEYRADVWSADGVTRFNSKETGPKIGMIRQLVGEQPGLARALMTTPV